MRTLVGINGRYNAAMIAFLRKYAGDTAAQMTVGFGGVTKGPTRKGPSWPVRELNRTRSCVRDADNGLVVVDHEKLDDTRDERCVGGSHDLRGGAPVACRAHNPEVAGSIPAPAIFGNEKGSGQGASSHEPTALAPVAVRKIKQGAGVSAT